MSGLTTLPTKTDGSLGRVKSDLPDSDPSPDLDYYVPAAEHEAIKDAIVALGEEVGLHDGSTAGSLVERVTTLEETATGIVDGDFAGSYEGMLYRTGAGAYEARRFAVSASAPSPSDGEASGYKAGSIWIQTDDGTPSWIWISLGDGGWKRIGSGESDVLGWTGAHASGSTLDLSAASIGVNNYSIRAIPPSGGMTIDLPDVSVEPFFMLIYKAAGAAGDGITLHPATGQRVNHVTGDHLLAGSERYVGGTGTQEAPLFWMVWSDGATWLVAGGPINDVLEATLTADGDLPDAEVVLLDTSAGPIDVQLPAVVTNRPRVWTLKIITTDGNGATFVPAASETIEGAAASLLMPSSDSGDLVSCTIFRARSGNWWIL